MNLTHDQLIDIAWTAATYLAVGAFSVTFYSLFQRKGARAGANEMNVASNDMNGTNSANSVDAAMSFVKFSDLSQTTNSNLVPSRATETKRPVSGNDREAVLNLIRQRLREVSPAERLADAMSKR